MMQPNPTFYYLILSVPTICVVLGGIITASMLWENHPRPALLTLVSMLILGVCAIVHPTVQNWFLARHGQELGRQTPQQVFLFISMVFGFIHAGVFGLLLMAVFIDRPRRAPSGETNAPRIP